MLHASMQMEDIPVTNACEFRFHHHCLQNGRTLTFLNQSHADLFKRQKMFSDDVIVIIARNKYLVYILINAKALHSFFFP